MTLDVGAAEQRKVCVCVYVRTCGSQTGKKREKAFFKYIKRDSCVLFVPESTTAPPMPTSGTAPFMVLCTGGNVVIRRKATNDRLISSTLYSIHEGA